MNGFLELRWVVFGRNRQLEYRSRTIRTNNWGDFLGFGDWTDWKPVETVDGDEAAYEDLRAAGGIAGAP